MSAPDYERAVLINDAELIESVARGFDPKPGELYIPNEVGASLRAAAERIRAIAGGAVIGELFP
jgi:hypothetical protein